MKPFFASLRLCVSFFFLSNCFLRAAPDPDAAATVVVFNERDNSSAMLAGYYAEKRGIPKDHLIPLSCPVVEVISREDYDKTIAGPLRKIFLSKGWWKTEADLENGRVTESKIRYVALMRGIPLKISAVASYEGDTPCPNVPTMNHNEAAVDSELSLLGLATRQITGVQQNPYGHCIAPFPSVPLPFMMLVCRLDAADPETVKRMINDSIAAEKTGLWGFAYVDSRGMTGEKGMAEGDCWLRKIADDAANNGIPCVHDDAPAQFPEHYPITRAALYFGWYSGAPEGPFKDPAFRFLPGAVAVHIYSYSASSLRKPSNDWCVKLLERGAAATLGNVYEPYLSFTPHLDVFYDRLRRGFNFAEAAYASEPVLSWMTTFIGDPLYRPFKMQQNLEAKPEGAAQEYAAYREGAACWGAEGRAAGEPLLLARAKALKSGIIYEGLGLLQAKAGDTAAALNSWAAAQKVYTEDADRIRCALHTIAALREQKKTAQALSLAREKIKAFPNADATNRFRAIVLELEPPPATPARSATPAPLPIVTPIPPVNPLPGHR